MRDVLLLRHVELRVPPVSALSLCNKFLLFKDVRFVVLIFML